MNGPSAIRDLPDRELPLRRHYPEGAAVVEDAELERRLVEAELAGRRTVADALARELEARRAARPGNVVSFRRERPRGA